MKKITILLLLIILLSACAGEPQPIGSNQNVSGEATDISSGKLNKNTGTVSLEESDTKTSEKYDFSQIEDFSNFKEDFLKLSKEFEKIAEFRKKSGETLSGYIYMDENTTLSVRGEKKIKELQGTVKYIFDNSNFRSVSFYFDDKITFKYFVKNKGSKYISYYFEEPNNLSRKEKKVASNWYYYDSRY